MKRAEGLWWRQGGDKIAVIDCILVAEGSLDTTLSHLKSKLRVKVIPNCREVLGTRKMKA